MFSVMNQHKYLDMVEIQETHKDCLRIVIAEARVSDSYSDMSPEEEPNDALREMLDESNSIEVTDSGARYEIVFDKYIAYAVTDESYAGGIEETFEGGSARIYSKSAFLNYISQGTVATEEYPGPFVHYGFYCLNQVIDIVSEWPPTVKLINAK